MQTVKIISDSTCDLSQELTERFNVDIVPLHVILGEDVYTDGVDVDREKIYAWAEETKDSPKTSAPSPEEIKKIFTQALETYKEIICFSIAEGMSASNSVMRLVAQEMEAEDVIHVVDSANLTTGTGLMVLESAEMAMNGDDAATILAHIDELKPRVRSSFVIDTLMYLYRGGRCSGMSAFVGQKLRLHPMIKVVDGEMIVGKKYRGNIDRVIMDYAHELEPHLRKAKGQRIFITHSGHVDDSVQKVYDYLKSLDHFEEIDITYTGSVVTSHCGPGTLGILFLAGEE